MPTKTYYQIFGSWKNWNEANQYCQSMHSNLASFHDIETYDLLVSLHDGMGETYAYIGGYPSGGSWKWSDGTTFSFTNWAANQPDEGSGARMALKKHADGVIDAYSTNTFPFICQFRFGN